VKRAHEAFSTFAVMVVGVGLVLGLQALPACSPAFSQMPNLTEYTAALAVCSATDAGFDAGVACMKAVNVRFCGDGGVWSEAGPDGSTVCDQEVLP
jgi:hypothetical protein